MNTSIFAAANSLPAVPDFVLLNADMPEEAPHLAPVIRPEDTIDTQYMSVVRFYNGATACSIRRVAGCIIRIPSAVYDIDTADMTIPLFDLTCKMSFVLPPEKKAVIRFKAAQARTTVFYNAPELCIKSAAVFRALALHKEMNGFADSGDWGETRELTRMSELLEDLHYEHAEHFSSSWMAPADLTYWAGKLNAPMLASMADRLVVSEAYVWDY